VPCLCAEPLAPKRPLEAAKYESLETLNAQCAAERATEAALAEKRARASGSTKVLSLKQEERRVAQQDKAEARAAKAAERQATGLARPPRAAGPRAAGPRAARPRAAAGKVPAEAMDEGEDGDAISETSDESEEEELLDEDAPPPLELPLPHVAGVHALHVDARALQVPGDIYEKLKPYQVEGVRFLHRRWCQKPLRVGEARGCVLGDDMVRLSLRAVGAASAH